jgi:hypothetical protein
MYDSRAEARIVDTESPRPATGQSLVHTSWLVSPSRRLGDVLLDVPKESCAVMIEDHARGRELHGTNFRHAVEFSRSGRTPSRLFRIGRGQPELRYPVGSAGSNRPSSARPPAWSPPQSGFEAGSQARRAWGKSDRLHLLSGLAATGSWLRASDKRNSSQRAVGQSNRDPTATCANNSGAFLRFSRRGSFVGSPFGRVPIL